MGANKAGTLLSSRRSLARYRAPGRLPPRRGGQVLEMAISFNFLILLAMGMVEFGQYFYIRHAFESAIRDGLRYGICSNATQAQMVSTITTSLAQSNITFNPGWLTFADISAGVTESDISQVPQGDLIQMTISTTYSSLPTAVRPLNAITGLGIGSGKMMTVSCVMGKE